MSGRRPVALVLRALGLGDLLTALPALRGVRRGLPEHQVVLATSPGVAPLGRRSGAADAIVGVAELGPLPFRGPIDVTVNLHGRGPASHARLAEVGARRTIGFDLPGGPAWPEDVHEVARWGQLLTHHGLPFRADDLELHGVAPAPGVGPETTIIHPGASTSDRRWPVDRWAEVARLERAAGRRVLVTGSLGERPLTAALCRRAGLPPTCDRSGTVDVEGLAALVAGAGRILSGDTGPAHLGVALRRPTVTVFGPVPPTIWGPPPDRPWHRVLWAGEDRRLVDVHVADVALELAELDRLGDPGGPAPPAPPSPDRHRRPVAGAT